MKKIMRFKDKKITIDGKIGTIHQEDDNGFCEFVCRDGGAIESVRMASRYIKALDNGSYVVRDTFRDVVDDSAKTHYPVIQSWVGIDFPNGEYHGRNFGLTKAGI